ncbi:sensor histidine kinase [Peribacillus kribbensis]|uniref:sensor histidine kinase n=1 Tax=Peribacillus kribbensis TaxID=356658 RepID=UPI0004181739|nr:sensor histidine kinase [Peribacillus kribbensis]
MTIILAGVLVLLLAFIFIQYRRNRHYKESLSYIQQKLKKIIDSDTDEKLLFHTDDEAVKSILTEVNRLLERNQKAQAHYNKTELSMRKMLSNISHDLKTPLTVVLGYAEMLQSEPDPKESRVLLQKVHTKTQEVLGLIQKFFYLAKLEAQDKDIAITRININEVCRKSLLDYYELLTSKDFEVAIELPPQDVYALGNEDELGRVLGNLLSNAISYGSAGKTVGIQVREDDQWIFMDVWDRGKGISVLHQDLVFERMYTLEDSRNKLYQGSGLGLTISKRLAEAMGGGISLESKPYEKTTFTIKLKKATY